MPEPAPIPPPPGPFDRLLDAPEGAERAREILQQLREDSFKHEASFVKWLILLTTIAGMLIVLISTPIGSIEFLGFKFTGRSEYTLTCVLTCIIAALHYGVISRYILLSDASENYNDLLRKLYPNIKDHFVLATLDRPSIVQAERLINRMRPSEGWLLKVNLLLITSIFLLNCGPFILEFFSVKYIGYGIGFGVITTKFTIAIVGLFAVQNGYLLFAFLRMREWKAATRETSQYVFVDAVRKGQILLEDNLKAIRSHAVPIQAAREAVDSLRPRVRVLNELAVECGIPITSSQVKALIQWYNLDNAPSWRERFTDALMSGELETPGSLS